MSGGHYNYMCYSIENTYKGEMENELLEEMLQDFCDLLKSLEWYKSDDTGQEDYHHDVEKFINKWTKSDYPLYLKAKSDILGKIDNFIQQELK